MAIQIDKKPSHRTTGSSENKFTIGDLTENPKEFAANVNGNEDPALIYDPKSNEWYLIRNQADRDAFKAGSLIPLGPGPTGPAGIDGETGPQGVTGMTGITGLQGSQGNTGVSGDTGVKGETGIAGDTGLAAQGVTGEKGETGIQGVTGSSIQGDTGLAGAGGSQGDTGLAGPQGDQGDTGLSGAGGAQGDTGLAGAQGDTGLAGAQGDTGLAGPQGDQGDTGLSGDQGTTGVGSPTVFGSVEITGDGTAQSTAHGLGVTPTKVLVSVTDNTADSQWTITEGSHTSTNVIVTIDTGVKYKILAMP